MKKITVKNLNILSSLLYKVRRRHEVKLSNEFADNQWLSTYQLLSESDRLTRKIALHAESNVEYYRNVFRDFQIDPQNFSFSRDWKRLPILEKNILQDNYAGLISSSEHSSNSYINHTGGSTGNPVQFLTDYKQYQRMVAWMDFIFSWAGWRYGEMRLELWGNREYKFPSTKWDYFFTFLSGHIVVPVMHYDEKDINLWWQLVKIFRPSIIYGYPSVLADFARWIDAEQRMSYQVKGIFCSAEIFYPEQRTIIEKVFNCKSFNQYGSGEAPCIACECPAGGMHVFVDINRVEFIDSENKFERNKDIIVTPLYNYAQPLLRYRLGDMGNLKEEACSCGRGYPLMELNIARAGDVFYGKNGLKIFPNYFVKLMYGKNWVRNFQFIQKEKGEIELNIVAAEGKDAIFYCKKLLAEITPKLRELMGTEVELVANLVDEIKQTASGKHRYIINDIGEGL